MLPSFKYSLRVNLISSQLAHWLPSHKNSIISRSTPFMTPHIAHNISIPPFHTPNHYINNVTVLLTTQTFRALVLPHRLLHTVDILFLFWPMGGHRSLTSGSTVKKMWCFTECVLLDCLTSEQVKEVAKIWERGTASWRGRKRQVCIHLKGLCENCDFLCRQRVALSECLNIASNSW